MRSAPVLVLAGRTEARLAATSGARFGLRRSVPLLAGITVALVSLVVVSAAGLGGLVAARPTVQMVLRTAGSAYLLWLAWKISRSGVPDMTATAATSPSGFRAGVMLTWMNPKAWTLGLSTAAGYSAISPDPLILAFTIGAVFTVVVIPNLLLWCLGGVLLAKVLRTERHWRTANTVLGLLLAMSVALLWFG
jgi:threonine/homoserine/homoserine lactone efflux protein